MKLQILANYGIYNQLNTFYYLADLMYLVISEGSIQQRIHLYYLTCNIIMNIDPTSTIDPVLNTM